VRLAFVSIMGNAVWAACEELWAAGARQAISAGHEVLISVYERAADAPQIKELANQGARIEKRTTNSWLRDSEWLSRLSGTYRQVEDFQADALCLSQGGTYDVGRRGDVAVLRNLLKRDQLPYVVLCHCEQPAPRRSRLAQARQVLAGANILGMLSDNLRILSEQHLGCSLPNARLFQNPLKFYRSEPLPWPTGETLRMAFVGRLEPIKGLDLLIAALGMARWQTRDWRLTVCGAGIDRKAYEQQVAIQGLASRVTFAGFVSDITEIWRHHHVLIMPSRAEGIPIALTEAMLCGRPVAATNVGGISQAIVDDASGFLIPQATQSDVEIGLERLWNARERLPAMGQRAFALTAASLDPNPAATLVHWLEDAARHGVKSNHDR
jgi:hypothetical protein